MTQDQDLGRVERGEGDSVAGDLDQGQANVVSRYSFVSIYQAGDEVFDIQLDDLERTTHIVRLDLRGDQPSAYLL